MIEAPIAAVELLERLARLIANDGHAQRLKPAQWEALRYLARANRFSRTPGGLTAWLGATKGTVSQTVMSLERAGLVAKSGHPADRRSVRLELTDAGHAMLQRDEIAALRHSAAALPPPVRAGLEDGLRALLAARLAASGQRPFGICRDCRHFSRQGGNPYFCRLLKEPLSENDSGLICVEQEPAAA
jgi:DNA-binding MarR family transcriptional regulator